MSPNNKLLTITIPCYNEARNIPLLLQRFAAAIGTRDDLEVLLVNNGSKDNSAEVVAAELPKYPFARTVNVEVNQGYGFGILTGLRNSHTSYIGWTHADLQTDPADVLKALDILVQHRLPEDMYVKGNRKGRPWMDRFFTWGMEVFESLYLRAPLHDINAQPNIFHRSFFMKWDDEPHDFSLDLYALYTAHRLGLRIVRFDVVFPERIHGQSSWNTGLRAKYKFIKRTLDFSVKLKKRLKKQ